MKIKPLRTAFVVAVLFALVGQSLGVLATDVRRVIVVPPKLGIAGTPGMFGVHVTVLPNGNVIVADPWYSLEPEDQSRVGIVALYRPDASLISVLRGSHTNDRIGSFDDAIAQAGITVLANGDFVVSSPLWHDRTGAVTWGDADTGWGEGAVVEVSAKNSIVGHQPGNSVGGSVVALTNGHFVVGSPSWDNGAIIDAGAVTWGDGSGSIVGGVSALNSLIGTHAFDYVGGVPPFPLPNGNYVVSSSLWDDGDVQDVGAATWCPGATGCTGAIDDNATLKGRRAGDRAANDVVPNAKGDYVVISRVWQNSDHVPVGAATVVDGTAGSAEIISEANSLHGSTRSDLDGSSVIALSNGNWVLVAPHWDAPVGNDVGAVTLMRRGAGSRGPISGANSLTGTHAADGDLLWAISLTNGNYVAGFPFWDDNREPAGIPDVGAVVWADGSSGIAGAIEPASNALIGSSAEDRVGLGRARALAHGNYVVSSPWWDRADEDGTRVNVGAVTWRSGTMSSAGIVSEQNSLVGSSDDDFLDQVIALPGGNYVVLAPSWDYGEIRNVGAANWCPATGCTGPIRRENALTGTAQDDAVGNAGFALPDGNYVALSWAWNSHRGAVTWLPGNRGTNGQISPQNSLVGTAAFDALGFGFNHYGAFRDGSYVIQNGEWDIPYKDAGAIVLARAGGGTVGALDLKRTELVAGHSPHSGRYTVWHYGEETRLLAVGDYLSHVVTLLQRESLFADGFDSSR